QALSSCGRCPAMTVTLEAGGADTYTQRAIPGSELSQDSGTFARTLLAMVQVIGLGVPAGRQFGGERGVDEPGDGGGVRAAGIPLQGERDELRWLGWPDEGGGVRGCEGWDEQDPVDIALVGPAGGGQFGVGEVDGGRADARLFEGLPLAERPGREQVRRTC